MDTITDTTEQAAPASFTGYEEAFHDLEDDIGQMLMRVKATAWMVGSIMDSARDEGGHYHMVGTGAMDTLTLLAFDAEEAAKRLDTRHTDHHNAACRVEQEEYLSRRKAIDALDVPANGINSRSEAASALSLFLAISPGNWHTQGHLLRGVLDFLRSEDEA